MASLGLVIFFSFILGPVYADNIVMENILKRVEEMNAQLVNLNRRVAGLELENLEKTTKITNLQKQLDDQNDQMSVLLGQQEEYQRVIDLLNRDMDKAENTQIQENDDHRMTDIHQDRYTSSSMTSGINLKFKSIENRNRQNKDNALNRRGRIVLGEGTQVAFSANISPHDYGPIGDGQIIKFDNVLTNIGSAYHGHSGIFTAPVDGVYAIYVTISGWKHSTDHSYLEVVRNGNHLCWVWVTTGDQSSQAMVITLNQNDDIYVKSVRANDILLGQTYSSFSGFLLY